MKDVIKIGIDYHGVITADPLFFARFTQIAVDRNCQIHVLSGGGSDSIEKYLEKNHICYTKIFSVLDHFENLHKVEYFADGSFKVEDELWNKAKADYCKEEKIDFHIDDSAIYGAYFTTPFCLYDSSSKKCAMNNYVIDFTKKPDEVLDDVLKAVPSLTVRSFVNR